MKQVLHIEADIDKPELLKNMVEKMVSRRTDRGFFTEPVPASHEALKTSSTEAYVCGSLLLREKKNSIRLHFDSSFLFTCIKSKNSMYEVTWSVSLS